MIGVFCALDLVLFYLFFEAGLIPMFLIRVGMSVVPACQYIAMMASSISTEPSRV
jgi:NADH:ubiquinone oxidoreductase subunit 4 (subunit M)